MYRHITAFGMYLTQHGVSENTHHAYRHDLNQFITYLMQHDVTDISDIEQTHIDAFIAYLETRAITYATAQRKCASIRHFLEFCARNDIEAHCPYTPLPVFCTEKTIDTISQTLIRHEDPYKRRDGWMIYIIATHYVPFSSLAHARIHQTYTSADHKRYVQIDGITIDITSYYVSTLPYILHDTNASRHVLFAYMRHGDPIVMPYTTWVQRMRAHVLAYTRPRETPFRSGSCDGADTMHKKQYSQFHERA